MEFRADPEAGKGRSPRIAFYSHDTIGLGHMRRNSAIARQLVTQLPDVSVLMLVGCPAGMVFEPHPGIDYVKLVNHQPLDVVLSSYLAARAARTKARK